MNLFCKIVLMNERVIQILCIMINKETKMNLILTFIQKCLIFEKEPQRIGLSQLNEPARVQKEEPSIKNKDIKLSDLMRRAG